MAKGNWKPEVIHPATRCRLCGHVIKKNDVYRVYLDGITPAHRTCAISKDREYTEWFKFSLPPRRTIKELLSMYEQGKATLTAIGTDEKVTLYLIVPQSLPAPTAAGVK